MYTIETLPSRTLFFGDIEDGVKCAVFVRELDSGNRIE